jgi:alpha-D-ribose 1-methylphosphonate 5-triphosphate diphosphatase
MKVAPPIDVRSKALDHPVVAIEGARVLIDGRLHKAAVRLDPARGTIARLDGDEHADRVVDAHGLMALPGIVDVHGDAFERQIMPRPRVHFPLDIALIDSDRQAIANGITTVFHGVTWSWEPGLRGADNARAILAAIEDLQPQLTADTRYHLRHETYNLDAEAEIVGWLVAGRIGALAFNDHMTSIVESARGGRKLAQMVERAGVSEDEFVAVVERTKARAAEVPAAIARLAAAAVAAGVPLLSHDDTGAEQRRWFRDHGCCVAEFPTTLAAAQEAVDGGDHVVFGAPNVVRGGSHTGWLDATAMVRQGLCTVLASDYYYPAPLLAAFRLVADGVVPLAHAWSLVSENAAAAVGLFDRGRIAERQRGDVLLVDMAASCPRIVAVFVGGRIVHLVEPWRLGRPAFPRAQVAGEVA